MSVLCPNCHQVIPDAVRYCAYCGRALGQHESPPFITRAGQRIETVTDVVPTLRRSGRAWRDGVYHLYNGHFETWFRSLGRHDLVDAVARIRQRTRDPERALERFVALLEAEASAGSSHALPGWLEEVRPAIAVPCPQCHQVLPGGVRYCAYCGAGVAGPSGPQAFVTRSGERLETIREIGQVLNRDARTRAEALYHLYNGHFETWFRSLGRYDLVDAVARMRQDTQDPEAFLNRFLLLVAASPAPGQVERPWGEQLREAIVPAELTTDPELRRASLYLMIGVLVCGLLVLAMLVLSALMGRC